MTDFRCTTVALARLETGSDNQCSQFVSYWSENRQLVDSAVVHSHATFNNSTGLCHFSRCGVRGRTYYLAHRYYNKYISHVRLEYILHHAVSRIMLCRHIGQIKLNLAPPQSRNVYIYCKCIICSVLYDMWWTLNFLLFSVNLIWCLI